MTNQNIKTPLIPLFKKFIWETEKGKRLQKNGKSISKSTLSNYRALLSNLIKYEDSFKDVIWVNTRYKYLKRNFLSERKAHQKFYKQFTDMLYNKSCTDNYVGMLIKTLRTFYAYLNQVKGFVTGGFYKDFHAVKEEIPIIVLSQDYLRKLLSDEPFHERLSAEFQISKDIFVVGCTIGLRFSDIIKLTNKNWQLQGDNHYIVTKSQKTKTETRIKIPNHIVQILNKYKNNQKTLLPKVTLEKFNYNLKKIGELAGWTQIIGKERSKRGQLIEIKKEGKSYRFCDLISSHMMRRTAITTLLTLGMPEQVVRKISGHKPNSTEFYKYVKFSESFQDDETDKAFSKLLTT
jgi:integrase